MEVKKTVVIGEDSYGIRKLSWKSLEKASDARTSAQTSQVRELGGDILKALRSDAMDEAAKKVEDAKNTPEGRAKARYDAYDREQILVAGVETRNGEKLSRQQILDDLDKPTAETLHREIVDLSDQPGEETEAAQGKS